MKKYDPKQIESKWQAFWEKNKTFSTPEDATPENKCYILPQLPYPSGSGLHVGHAEVYTACDIYARYQRMKGKKVLQVFGLDSFGLPAENYAIKTNVHPRETIDKTTENFVSQVKALGVSVDWDRFVRSSDPSYYKFTQWFFLLMYERGLAYRKKQAVNWCESCKTVLANEQVVEKQSTDDGRRTTVNVCERCGTEIIQREMEQWYLKITDYADRLIDDLDKVDWPVETVKRQRDWIGRSEGAEITFSVISTNGSEEKSFEGKNVESQKSDLKEKSSASKDPSVASLSQDDNTITVFTTRPDTLFGATYMVLAPEHALLQKLSTVDSSPSSIIENWDEVEAYIQETAKKTDLDRQVNKEKTGVELKGVKAINPANGEEIPVWIADYVIATYGTGAIMAVPAHDERDFAFAKKFGLKIVPVVLKEVGESMSFVMGLSEDEIKNFGGEVVEKTDKGFFKITIPFNRLDDYKEFIRIKMEPKFWNEFSTKDGFYFIFKHENGEIEEMKLTKDTNDLIDRYGMAFNDEEVKERAENVYSWLAKNSFYESILIHTDPGIAINSDFLNGLPTQEAKTKIIDWLEKNGHGKRKIQYKLRDWSVSRQRFWGAPVPMLINEQFPPEADQPMAEAIDKEQRTTNNEQVSLPDAVVHVHAWGASPESHFRNWLREEEKNLGVESITPMLPHTDMPQRREWRTAVETVLPQETKNTVLEGRSLGAFTALELAQTHRFRKLILIAPTLPIQEWKAKFTAVVSDQKARATVLDMVQNDLDYSAIKKNCGEIVVFLSTNDPYIPLEASETLLKQKFPHCRIVRIRDAGHFGTDDGYATFDALKDEIVREIRPDLRTTRMDDLPVLLPNDVDFKPTGQSPLTYSPSFQNGVEEKYGTGWKREVDTLDTFMCSSWYFFRYLDPHNEHEFASPEALKKWMPVDFYLGGPEHVNGHLLYSRFFTKVLFDAGYIDFDEPFAVNRHQGLILGPDGRKMSKRWGNVVNPTDVVEKYGADTMRMYEMFMGPLEDDKPWDENGVKGVRRFLERVWNLQERVSTEALEHKSTKAQEHESTALEQKLHATIKKVGEDLESLGFNTAIAKLMELVNAMYKVEKISVVNLQSLLLLLAPFAPHIAEEMWQNLGNKDMLTFATWPTYDESKLVSDTITLGVQINGKLRATIDVSPDASEEEAKASALAEVNVQKWLEGKEPKKVIYVKGKIVSVVV